MNKADRQALIQEIVQNNKNIQRQEDIVDILTDHGLDVTQATISRDIKEMELIKVPVESGGYRYSMPEDPSTSIIHQLESLLEDSFVSIDSQDNLILIETIPGSGEVLGNVLRNDVFKNVFAVVVNDDNVLVICRNEKAAEELRNLVLQYI